MKKIVYKIGPDSIEVGGLGAARQDGIPGDRMERDKPVEVTDEKAADMLTNPMFTESSASKGGK
ncbi:MAG: hypothetical protein M0R70_12610 [Nitrospirae bacterium]|nr:hypothetical protein [Nitrospirota bacterium]